MQNAEITESKADTQKDYLDTREVTVSSEVAEASSEKKAKVKRSRFSVALRSLSLSRSKKETNKEPRSLPVSLDTEPTFSSGTEDSFETASTGSKPKKKSKLSRHFLLGNLKKSKVYQKAQDSDNATLDDPTTLDISKKRQQNNETNTDEKYPKQTTVQITISGKKVEPSSSSGSELKRKGASPTQKASSVSETDYLTPLPTSAAAAKVTKTTSTTTATIAGKGGRTTKVIVSKVGTAPVKETSAQSSPAPSSSPFPAKAVAATLVAKSKKLKSKKASTLTTQPTNTEVTAEKIVITQSTQDTPPPERAPIKPSRVTSTPIASPTLVSSAVSQTGAVRKPTTKVAAPNTLPSQLKHHHTPSSKKSLKSVATVAITAISSKREREINAQQRGHRISRPTTTATTQPSARSSLKPEAAKQQARESLAQIRLQSESHGSTEHPLPPTPPYIQTQSALLQSSSPPIQENITSKVQTLENQQHSSENEHPNEADAISSAESAQPTEYAHYNLQEELATAVGSRSVSPTNSFPVRFAVGSAVRPLTAPSAYEAAGAAALASAATQELSSSDSQSESSLRRIRYQTQTTLYGDHDSVQGRRETLHYQSVASEPSNDTEESDSGDTPMPAFGDLTMDQEMEPTIMTSTSEKREHLYKILVIGELGTGKTSFIKRYVHQFFSQNYRATIGVDFALKVLHWDPNTIVRLQLWDIAGQERFGNMTRVYYKEAVGAFIVFDVTRSGTFDCVTKWKEDLDSKVQLPDGNPIPCILLANKCDQDKQGVVSSSERMDEYVHENGFAGWFETSAKENINIDEAARALVNKILLNDKLISDTDLADNDSKFNLNNPDNTSHSETKSKCAC